MTILYESVAGQPNLGMSIFFYVLAAFVAIMFIIVAIKIEEPVVLLGLIVSVFIAILGYSCSLDTSYPIVKATLNDTVPYVEVAKHYEYISREGDIWTFKVLENNKGE